MDKEFWITLAKNDYKIPQGHTLEELKQIIFGYLSSTDPELRDDIAYIVYANWLKREMFSKKEVSAHVNELIENLNQGISETESDSVFLRAFSVLLLAEIVHNDNKKPLLEKDQIQSILEKGLWYLNAEQDPRGYIPVKGWAHALAHTADLMLVLGKNQHTEKIDLERILQTIAIKLIHSTNWLYFHGEDDRLANAVIGILQRDLISLDFVENWLKSMIEPEVSWVGAYMDSDQAISFHNTRNFLRSLSQLIGRAEPWAESLNTAQLVNDALEDLKPY